MLKSDRDGRLVGLFIRKIDERHRNAKLKTRRSELVRDSWPMARSRWRCDDHICVLNWWPVDRPKLKSLVV